MSNGCRSCTDTALCRSCRRRATRNASFERGTRTMPPEDMNTMQTAHDFVSSANTAALSAITDACGDGTGAFCGDL